MTKQIVTIFLLLASFSVIAQTNQSSDPVLFSVGETDVKVSEFEYIYSKANGKKADFSEESLKEYLDLYIKFKLKVEKAKDMQLDTIPALRRELNGYRRQLASTYLQDKEILDNLVKEAHERMKYDVSISHIFIGVAKESDGTSELNRVREIRKEIAKGKIKFEAAAEQFSEDPSTAPEGGYLRYITAFDLKRFYQIENAAYSINVGEVSEPVRSIYGYHLVKVNDKRPARGEMDAAHILVRVESPQKEAAAQQKIRQAHKSLEKGMSFDEAVKEFSEDQTTRLKGGQLGVVSINKFEKSFEETIFRLENDGDYSQPFRSKVGWHIVKRVKKRPLAPLKEMQRGLKARVQRDSRFEIVQKSFIERLKKEYDYKENTANIKKLSDQVGASFLTPQWKPDLNKLDGAAFSFADQSVSIAKLAEFLSRSTKERTNRNNKDAQEAFRKLLERFVSNNLTKYEEGRLPEKYPDFKSLMREYEEGILLFEATNVLVWGKAAKDSIGLQSFYQKNTKNYMWDERVEVTTYAMPNEHPTKLAKARKYAKKKSSDKVLAKINTADLSILTATTSSYEKGQNKDVDELKWKKKYVGANILNGDKVSFLKVEKVVKPQPKSFKDARGYIIADYQEYLEKEWLKELEKEYPLQMNEEVFQSLIKK
ncbi:MAG: peptidylprolyl isomerase [Saprospiraceae bacterium]